MTTPPARPSVGSSCQLDRRETEMTDPREVAAENVAALNAGDEVRIRATYADGAVMQAPGPTRLEGGDAATEYVRVWLRAFPDARQTIVNEIAAGDWVVH